MLTELGKFIEKRPWLVVGIIIAITIGFASLIPFMETGTSMEDFLPEDERVEAQLEVNEYFGRNYEILMVYAEKNKAENAVTPEALKEEYMVAKEMEKIDQVEGSMSAANFVDAVCQMEYRKSLLECSNEEIKGAFNDLMSEQKGEMKMMDIDDPNEEHDFRIFPKSPFGFSNDCMDIKNYYINETAEEMIFSIELQDLSKIDPSRPRPATAPLANTMEWIIGFDSLTTNMSYRISARIEPTSIIDPRYTTRMYLWIEDKTNETYWPIQIENGTVTFDLSSNRIIVNAQKEDLKKFYAVMDPIPTKYGNTFAAVRYTRNVVKLFDKFWNWGDIAPDNDRSPKTFLIKGSYLEEMKMPTMMLLSKDYSKGSPDSTLIMIQINGSISPKELTKTSRELVQIMDEVDGQQDYVDMKATGGGVIAYEIDDMTSESNKLIVPGIFLAIMLILLINFRKPSYVVLPLVGLGISIIWLFGTMALLGMKFNVMAVALVPLLMGLGVDYSVHTFHNYIAEVEKGKSSGEAIIASIRDVGTAMFLATITTAIAFLSFLTASIPPVRDFGILCAIGITYTFITTITLQASIRYILDRKKIKFEHEKHGSSIGRAMKKASSGICDHPKTIIIIASIVTICMIGGAINVRTGFNMEEFLPSDNPAIETMKGISEDFPFASQEQEYILIKGEVASVDTIKGISKTHENLGDDEFVAKMSDGNPKANSIVSCIQEALRDDPSLSSKFKLDKDGLPANDRDVKKLYDYLYESDTYGPEVKMVLHRDGSSYDATLVRVYTALTSSGRKTEDVNRDMETLHRELEEDKTSYGSASAIVTGPTTLIYTITNSLMSSQITSTIICLILATIVIMVAYRKPLLGLITMIPVALSIIWIMGTMYFMGYSFNVMTVMVTSLTIGLGITYAIHAVERFRLTADRTGDVREAVMETVGHTGGALLIAAITTIAGFGMLVLSPMPPEQQFGIITAMAIAYSFLISVIILPPFLVKWGKWRKKRKGYIISPKRYDVNNYR